MRDLIKMTIIRNTKVGISPPLKANQKAYLLDGQQVSDLADLANVEQDLNLVASACRIVQSRSGSPSTNMLQRACIDSALMRYRRCFTTGRRTRLTEHDLLTLDEAELALHDLVIFVANKSIAHSVDTSECGIPYLLVESDPESRKFKCHIRTYTGQPSHYNLIDTIAFEKLSLKVCALVHEKAEDLAEMITSKIKERSPSYVLALPEVPETLMDRDEVLRRWEAEALAAGQKRRKDAGIT